MKRLVMLLLICLMVLSGCNRKQETPETAKLPEDVPGSYHEQIAGRGMLDLDETGKITVNWASSAFEKAHWEIQTEYDPGNSRLNYKDAVMTILTYTDEEHFEETEVYTDGTGYFTIKENTLLWHNDKEDNGSNDVTFVKNEQQTDQGTDAGIANPWIETDNLNTAVKEAGVEFDILGVDALPKGDNTVYLDTYMAMPGILSAIFRDGDNEMLIRKSNIVEGRDLSGDYNKYPKAWDEQHKGIEVHCEGSDDGVRLAYFDIAGEHYTISFTGKDDTQGLTLDEVFTLVEYLQPSGSLK